MLNFNNHKAWCDTLNHIQRNHKRIKIRAGKCRYNYRCHMNSVHEALKNNQDRVAVVMQVCGNISCVHFINYCRKKRQYTDNTLGEHSRYYDYYFVKWVEEEDFHNVNTILWEEQKYWRKRLNWWLRLTSNIEF